jgi:predicted nuclease of predicted toxin-antitoxin system
MLTFLVDEQLPQALVRWLIARGHHARHVADLGLSNTDDIDIANVAKSEDLVIVSKDVDFAWLHAQDPASFRLILLRLGNCTSPELLRRPGGPEMSILSKLRVGSVVVIGIILSSFGFNAAHASPAIKAKCVAVGETARASATHPTSGGFSVIGLIVTVAANAAIAAHAATVGQEAERKCLADHGIKLPPGSAGASTTAAATAKPSSAGGATAAERAAERKATKVSLASNGCGCAKLTSCRAEWYGLSCNALKSLCPASIAGALGAREAMQNGCDDLKQQLGW